MKEEDKKRMEKEILDETLNHPFSIALMASLNEDEQSYVRAQITEMATKLCVIPAGIRDNADKKEFWDEITDRLGINNVNKKHSPDGKAG